MDLTETGDMRKRRQEYTEELHKKHPNNLDNHNGVISDLEPDILECAQQFQFLHILTNVLFSVCFYKSRSNGCEAVPRCGFDLKSESHSVMSNSL